MLIHKFGIERKYFAAPPAMLAGPNFRFSFTLLLMRFYFTHIDFILHSKYILDVI